MADDNNKKMFFIRNGISVTFLLLLVVSVIIMLAVTIEDSTEVELIRVSDNGYIGLIITETMEAKLLSEDSLLCFNLNEDCFSFRIDSIKQDNTFPILYISPISSNHSKLSTNHKIIYTKRNERLWKYILRRK